MPKLRQLAQNLAGNPEKNLKNMLKILEEKTESFNFSSLEYFLKFYFSSGEKESSIKNLMQQCAAYIEWEKKYEDHYQGEILAIFPVVMALSLPGKIAPKLLWEIMPKDHNWPQRFFIQLIHLHAAYEAYQPKIYELIILCLINGADVNQPSITGQKLTPLMLAINNDDEKLCKKLLHNPQLNVNQLNGLKTFNALHQCVFLRKQAIFNLLMQCPNINLKEVTQIPHEMNDNMRLLLQAPSKNSFLHKKMKQLKEEVFAETVEVYLFFDQETALTIAARRGYAEYIPSLMEKDPTWLKQEDQKEQALLFAVEFNQEESFKVLLPYCDRTALIGAIKNKRIKLLEKLLEKMEPDSDVAFSAFLDGDPQVIEVFKNYYVKTNSDSKIFSLPSHEEKKLTGYASLIAQNYSKEEILELQKPTQEEIATEPSPEKSDAYFTWFDGRFSTKHPHIKYIDPMGYKTPNQYFYDNPDYCDYGVGNILRFARNENQQGIKDYKANDSYEITLSINGEKICTEKKYPSGEDKLMNTKNRVLLFSFQSKKANNGKEASLIIPVKDEIDPHNKASLKGVKCFHIELFDNIENDNTLQM